MVRRAGFSAAVTAPLRVASERGSAVTMSSATTFGLPPNGCSSTTHQRRSACSSTSSRAWTSRRNTCGATNCSAARFGLAVSSPPGDRAHALALLACGRRRRPAIRARCELVSEAVELLARCRRSGGRMCRTDSHREVQRRTPPAAISTTTKSPPRSQRPIERAARIWPIMVREFLSQRASSIDRRVAQHRRPPPRRAARPGTVRGHPARQSGHDRPISWRQRWRPGVVATLVPMLDEPGGLQDEPRTPASTRSPKANTASSPSDSISPNTSPLELDAAPSRSAAWRLASTAVVAHLRRLAGDLEGADDCTAAGRSRSASPNRSFVGGLATVTRSALWRHRGADLERQRR